MKQCVLTTNILFKLQKLLYFTIYLPKYELPVGIYKKIFSRIIIRIKLQEFLESRPINKKTINLVTSLYIFCIIDVDECQSNHVCEYKCVNIYGSYKCTCQKGYEPHSRQPKSCTGIPRLIFYRSSVFDL